ncbi:MAG: alpha/beta fold hydrolase [Hydrogenophaga sp.]|nr:alpha/beta fold hydrolase [Hydrogenophaga sp.]
MALGLAWWIWPHSKLGAALAATALLFAYAPVMAFELMLVAAFHGRDPAPRPTWQELLRAWWGEVALAPRVFAWRQPFRSSQWPDTATGQSMGMNPPARAVVFIHGFVCNRAFWHPWMLELRKRNVPYASVSLEPVFGSIDGYLDQVEEAVERAHASTGLPPLLICHSMGGLVARAWMARDPNNSARIHRVVTIGTPHRGTWLARFSHLPNGRQMRQACGWLNQLAELEAAARPMALYEHFTCWYSNADNVVFPSSTATLPGADNRLVRGTAHVALAFHPRVMRESLAMVASAASSPMERTAS